MVLPFGSPIMVSMRGGVGAVGTDMDSNNCVWGRGWEWVMSIFVQIYNKENLLHEEAIHQSKLQCVNFA